MIQGVLSDGAFVEDTLGLWTSALRNVKGRVRSLFTQDRGLDASSDSFPSMVDSFGPHGGDFKSP